MMGKRVSKCQNKIEYGTKGQRSQSKIAHGNDLVRVTLLPVDILTIFEPGSANIIVLLVDL
jgi:hypothetical protein